MKSTSFFLKKKKVDQRLKIDLSEDIDYESVRYKKWSQTWPVKG